MTDKQIIDGIDITGCVRLQDDRISCDLGGECKDWGNCYYKQLKRKEQECQQAMDNYVQLDLQRVKEYNELVDLYKDKEQECEELKIMLKDLSYENQKLCYQIEEQTKQLEPFKDEYFKRLDNVVIAELAKKSIRITAENSKLEQTLTEIKEIAEEEIECKTY